jgi:ribose/xylose/arabinose/galactoside ABC-type transport system permease subunit
MDNKHVSARGDVHDHVKEFIRVVFARFGIIIAFALLILVFSMLSPSFLKINNILNVLRQVSINGIITIAMMLVIITGGIDLSVGSMVAFSGVILAIFVRDGHNMWLGMLVGVAAATALGCVNGFFVAKRKMAPFIVTLAMMTIARGLTYVVSNSKPISPLAQKFVIIGKGNILGIPIPVIILFVIFITILFVLNFTAFGRYIYAVGGNERTAFVSGINTDRVKILVYSTSGLLCGLAAVVLTARVSAGLPVAANGYELDAIAATVIGGTSLTGGKGRLWGAMIGVLIIGVINNGLDLMNVFSYYQQIVKGVIILLAVEIDQVSNKRQ